MIPLIKFTLKDELRGQRVETSAEPLGVHPAQSPSSDGGPPAFMLAAMRGCPSQPTLSSL